MMNCMEKYYRIAVFSYLKALKNYAERYGRPEKREIRFKLRTDKFPENIDKHEFIEYITDRIPEDFPDYTVETAELKRTRIWITIYNETWGSLYDDECDNLIGYERYDRFGMWPGCDIPYITGDEWYNPLIVTIVAISGFSVCILIYLKKTILALRVGFEPTTAETTAPVFETGALDHSAILAYNIINSTTIIKSHFCKTNK